MHGPAKLKKYLHRQGLTQEQFAVLARVPGPQVSLWLSGRRRPGLDSAFKLEQATGGAVRAADWRRPSSPRRAA